MWVFWRIPNHANIEELDVTKSYVSHADRIFNIHLSECNRGIPGSGHGIPRDLCKAMLAAGYKGNFIVEAFNANVPETKPLLRLWAPLGRYGGRNCSQGAAIYTGLSAIKIYIGGIFHG